jgi:aminoglycoside/choline kinase family phosphotransferase
LDFTEKACGLFRQFFGSFPDVIEPVSAHASKRNFVRLRSAEFSVIVSFNPDILEDQAFVGLTKQFQDLSLPVPNIYSVDEKQGLIMMTDLGNITLYDVVTSEGVNNNRVINLYRQALLLLIEFQITAGRVLDYSVCYPSKTFDYKLMQADVNRFDKDLCERIGLSVPRSFYNACNELCQWMSECPADFFMYRDFQSRNIMVDSMDQLWFIDYQNGCRGPLQYDVVSLLYQSRTSLDASMRDTLFRVYTDKLVKVAPFLEESFLKYYPAAILLRLFQVLGRYGYLGLGEGNPQFLHVIPPTISALQATFEEFEVLADRFQDLRSFCLKLVDNMDLVKDLVNKRCTA